MDELKEILLAPTKDLIETLEKIKECLTYEQRTQLALLKLQVEMYEEKKARDIKLKAKYEDEKRKHNL